MSTAPTSGEERVRVGREQLLALLKLLRECLASGSIDLAPDTLPFRTAFEGLAKSLEALLEGAGIEPADLVFSGGGDRRHVADALARLNEQSAELERRAGEWKKNVPAIIERAINQAHVVVAAIFADKQQRLSMQEQRIRTREIVVQGKEQTIQRRSAQLDEAAARQLAEEDRLGRRERELATQASELERLRRETELAKAEYEKWQRLREEADRDKRDAERARAEADDLLQEVRRREVELEIRENDVNAIIELAAPDLFAAAAALTSDGPDA